MTTEDLFLKAVVVENCVQIRTRSGEVIMKCYDVTAKKAIKRLRSIIDTNLEERKQHG